MLKEGLNSFSHASKWEKAAIIFGGLVMAGSGAGMIAGACNPDLDPSGQRSRNNTEGENPIEGNEPFSLELEADEGRIVYIDTSSTA